MAKTRTPGITVLADGRLFIDKRHLGVRIGLRVGAITQEQAKERLRVKMARIELLARLLDEAAYLTRRRKHDKSAVALHARADDDGFDLHGEFRTTGYLRGAPW